MSRWTGRQGSPDTRIGTDWQVEMELRKAAKEEAAPSKTENLLNKRTRQRREAQAAFDGRKGRYGR